MQIKQTGKNNFSIKHAVQQCHTLNEAYPTIQADTVLFVEVKPDSPALEHQDNC